MFNINRRQFENLKFWFYNRISLSLSLFLTKQNFLFGFNGTALIVNEDHYSTITMAEKVLPPTNITDLCTNCLFSVFHNLRIIDLVNLSEANLSGKIHANNDRYKQCIAKAFRGKVRNGKGITSLHVGYSSAENDDEKILRTFGKEIENLSINYKYDHSLDDVISRNCWKTLSKIEFEHCNNASMSKLERSFLNVEWLAFCNGRLGSTLGQLKKWFPNVVHLQFKETNVSDAKCIHEHFPQLKSITVWNDRCKASMKYRTIFTNSDLKILLLLNPQLETLNIRHDEYYETVSGGSAIIVDWDLVKFITEHLQLKKLKLNLENYWSGPKWQLVITIHSLTALHVKCDHGDWLDTIEIATPNLNKLKLKLKLYIATEFDDGNDRQLNYEAIATLVIRVKPKVLKINAEFNKFAVDNVQFLKITRTLPQLQELFIKYEWEDDAPDAVLNLLVNSSALNKLVVVFVCWECSEHPEDGEIGETFREKIVRNDAVASLWSFNHECRYINFEIASIVFQRKEQKIK